jgi:hypothetical protein
MKDVFYIAREGERQRKLFFSYRVVHKFNLAFTESREGEGERET